MVIADNETRWNSTYTSIQRGLKLCNKIRIYSDEYKDELGDDFLLPEDWNVLRRLERHLEPFKRATKQLEGHAGNGHHGAIWEALPIIEHLLKHLEGLKQTVSKKDTRIWECVNNSWAKLNGYYQMTDNQHAVYAAATLLHPAMRLGRFKRNWTGALEPWIQIMETKCREVWTTEFLPLLAKNPPMNKSDDSYTREVMGLPQDDEVDELTKYNQDVTTVSNLNTFNPIKWWDDAKTDFPTLHLWAFDTLAIPAMSAECERVFSSAKKLITPERNRLHEQVIEASECLKNWWDRGLIQQQPNTAAEGDSEDCELEDEDDCDI